MPYSFQLHTATSGQTVFSFASIDGFVTSDDLRIYVNGVVQATSGVYTVNTTTSNVTFLSGRTAGDTVLIRRFTAALRADREVDFVDGSILTATDLDNSALQLLYLVQEGLDEAKEFCLRLNDALTAWDAKSKKITNVDTPAAGTDAANKNYVDTAALGGITGAANQVLATPNGASGSASIRALVAADIPTITSVKVSNFDTQVRTSRLDQMASPNTALSMATNRVINVVDPSGAQDAATKNYCDTTFLNPDPQVYTSTYASGSYSTTDSIVVNIGPSGFVRTRVQGHLLPLRRICRIEGIVGPFAGNSNGPHWFSLYNGGAAASRFRILRAHFNWVANKAPWFGTNPQAPDSWDLPQQSYPGYSNTAGTGPFALAGVSDGTGIYTVAAGADWKFYKNDPTYWSGSYAGGDGTCTTTGGIGPVVAATIVNGVREGTYSSILMEIIRLT